MYIYQLFKNNNHISQKKIIFFKLSFSNDTGMMSNIYSHIFMLIIYLGVQYPKIIFDTDTIIYKKKLVSVSVVMTFFSNRIIFFLGT